MPDRERPPAYVLGRAYSGAEVIVIARRATFDPGVFCKRRTDHNGPEELHRWQARAVAIALGPCGPMFEALWSNLDPAASGVADGEIHAVATGDGGRLPREEAGDAR